MQKFCRACNAPVPDTIDVCARCGLQHVIVSVIHRKQRRIWNSAGLCVGVLSVVSALLASCVVWHTNARTHQASQKLPLRFHPEAIFKRSIVLEEGTRKVYPYSIVAGGAASVEEAKTAMSRPDVRANYADMDLTKLREVKLETSLSGYVSYRFGEKIYWTAKKLTLHAGETVFTDGVHIARGRCLNCYSKFPMMPIRPTEPTEKVLDTPVDVPVFAYKFPMLPVETPSLPPRPAELTPMVPILPGTTPIKGGGGIGFPLIPIIPPIHRHHPTHQPPGIPGTPGGPPPPVIVIPPVAVVPEPKFTWILAAGLLVMGLIYALRRRTTLRLPNLSTEKLQPSGINVVEP